MKKIFKRIFSAVISFALAVLGMVAGIFPAALPVQAETALAYEKINVLDDLTNSTIDGKEFSLTDYNFDAKKETQVISFVEYCYSFYENKQDKYGLYVYVYNPKGLQFDTESPLNTIQFIYGFSTNENYAKYPLIYLNCSLKENYEGLFYKFKVSLSEEEKQRILQTVNSSDRVYRVSGIELLTQGNVNATEYSVATTYHYSGYASGYGSNANAGNTLQCSSEETEVLSLEVHGAQYRPKGTNGKNEYTQDSLHSVYFAVPNEILNRYGTMTAVHAKWLDAVLKPALVTGNQEAYDAIKPLLGMSIKDLSTFSYMYLGAYAYQKNGEAGSLYLSGYSYYNPEPLMKNDDVLNYYFGRDIDTLYSLYYSGSEANSADNYTLSSEKILADLKASKGKYGGSLVNGKYSRYMFESVADKWTDVNLKADESFSLTDEIIDKSWWDKFWGLQGSVTTNTFDGIKAIYAVKDSDMSGTIQQVSQRLFISEADYSDFLSFYNANKAKSTVYLFRYQVRDYVAQEATLLKENTSIFGDSFKVVDTNAYFFQETVNLDFDIIDVTFSNGESETVIPVVSSPIDVVPDPTPPVYTETDGNPNWWIYIAVIAGLIVLAIVMPVLTPVIRFLAWFISLPFKLIGKFFRWIGRRRKGL